MKRRTLTTMEFGSGLRQIKPVFKIDETCYEIYMLLAFNHGYEQFIYLGIGHPILPLLLEACEIRRLHEKLQKAFLHEGISHVIVPNKKDRWFKIIFKPRDGNFCYSTISVVDSLLMLLAVNPKDVNSMISCFGIKQETQVKRKGEWMSYSQFLHLTHPMLLRAHRA